MGHPEFDGAIVQAFADAHGHIRVAQVTPEGDPRTQVLSLIDAGEVDVKTRGSPGDGPGAARAAAGPWRAEPHRFAPVGFGTAAVP
ncbi:MAG: hypothetical protein L6E13_04465 [Firmicutes bacterium]|nr:hypothetical protein [Bacillota bacterium]